MDGVFALTTHTHTPLEALGCAEFHKWVLVFIYIVCSIVMCIRIIALMFWQRIAGEEDKFI